MPYTDEETKEEVEAGDLSLYIVRDCSTLASSCERVSDLGGQGVQEAISFTALASETYFIIVDGFAGSSSAYDIQVNNVGEACALVPVELQSFTVE